MKFQISCFVCILLQVCGGNNVTQELVLPMQKSMECLIEKVMTQVQDHCTQMRPIAQCIPEKTLDELVEIVKKSADCVHKNEKNYINVTISEEERSRNFFQCYEDAKTEVREVINSMEVTECPENVMEKAKEMDIGTCSVRDRSVTVDDYNDSSYASSSMSAETTTASANE